jgi:DNA-binding XRE family transcriptional regulator
LKFSIKQARLYAGKTQAEMAKALGIHRQTYMHLERDPYAVTVAQGYAIAKITGVNFEDIFFGNDST